MFLQVGGNGQLATIERSVAQSEHAGARLDLQCHEVPARTRHDDFRSHDRAILL